MTNIFFAGDIKSPFIKTDINILKGSGYGVTVLNTPISFGSVPGYLLSCFKSIPSICSSDVLYIWFADVPAVPLMLLAKMFGKKIIVSTGDYEITADEEIEFGNQRKLIRGWISRWVIRAADAVMSPSDYYVPVLEKISSGRNVVISIPCAIDTSLCSQTLPKKEDLIVTTYCGKGLEKRKGIDVFLQTKSCTGFNMEVYYRVPREKFISILKRARVYCYLGRGEAFGVSVAEAMALGCIPVVSNSGASPWLVSDAGVVVPYGDVQATANGISKAMKMGYSKCRARALEFSLERRTNSIRNLIDSLL